MATVATPPTRTWLNVLDVDTPDHPLEVVLRDSSVQTLEKYATRLSSKNSSQVVLYCCTEDHQYVGLVLHQPISVYVRLPPELHRSQVAKLAGIPGVGHVEYVERTLTSRYVPHKPGDRLDRPVKLPFARLEFPSQKLATIFYRQHVNYKNKDERVKGWFQKLSELDIPIMLKDKRWWTVHHLEKPFESFCNAVDRQLGTRENKKGMTTNSWICVENIRWVSEAVMLTRESRNATIDLSQIVAVDNATRDPMPYKVWSFDFETFSERRQFPRTTKAADRIINCGTAWTSDGGVTIERDCICLGRTDPIGDGAKTTVVHTEAELLNTVWLMLRVFAPHLMMSYNGTGYDNIVLITRSFLFHYCHTHMWDELRHNLMHAGRLAEEHAKLVALFNTNHIGWRELEGKTRQMFKIHGKQPINPTHLPLEAQIWKYCVDDGFDATDYLYYRSGPDVEWMWHSGRIPMHRMECVVKPFTGNTGVPLTMFHFSGWVVLDMWHHLQRWKPTLPDFRLKATSQQFLPEDQAALCKIDKSYDSVFEDWASGCPKRRRENAVYCDRDAVLPIWMAMYLTVWGDNRELAMLHRIELRELIFRGQQAMGRCNFRKFMFHLDYIHDTADIENVKAKGATVQEAKVGFHEYPVATLDFSSLYPSEACQNNLCGTTITHNEKEIAPGTKYVREEIEMPEDHPFADPAARVKRVITITNPDGTKTRREVMNDERFFRVLVTVRLADGTVSRRYIVYAVVFIIKSFRGLVPTILEATLGERGKVKKQMKAERDLHKKALLNSKQLALKTSANSTYGFLLASTGDMRMPWVGVCITHFGRKHIDMVKVYVTQHGYVVIYGDTDSVLVSHPGKSFRQAAIDSEEMCELVNNDLFEGLKWITIELDYLYACLYLKCKKKYAGPMLKDPKNDPTKRKMEAKGLSMVRRDVSPYISGSAGELFDVMMSNDDPTGSIKIADTAPKMKRKLCQVLDRLVDEDIELDDYAITQSKKPASKYKNPEGQANVVLAEKINKRVRNGRMKCLPLRDGDRFKMLKVERTEDGVESKRVVDTVESPDYMKEHPELGLKVDRMHVLKGLESTLAPDIKWHIPDNKRYFLKARSLLQQQTPEAKRARRLMGFKEDRSRRWITLPIIPKARKRKSKQPRELSEKEKRRRMELFRMMSAGGGGGAEKQH